MSVYWRSALCALAIVALSRCGGGGGSEATSGNPPPNSPPVDPNAKSTSVAIDPTIPLATTSKIAQVLTSIDSTPGVSAIQVATGRSGNAFVLALDSDGNTLLAGMAETTASSLTFNSTALVLTRIVIGEPPAGVSESTLNQYITSAPEFSALADQVRVAASAGRAPMLSSEVLSSLATMRLQVAEKLAPLAGATSEKPSDAPAAYPLPFSIVSGLGNAFSVYVHSAGSGGSVNLVNAMPISWSAYTEPVHDPAAPLPRASEMTTLEANSVLRSLLDHVTPWLGPPTVEVPGKNGVSVDLTLLQTAATRRANWIAVARDIGSMAGKNLPDACAKQIVPILFKTDEIEDLASTGSTELFKNYLISKNGPSIVDLRTLSDSCFDAWSGKAAGISKFAGAIAKILAANNAVTKVLDATTLASRLWFVFHENETVETVAVCMSRSTSGAPTITDCVDSLKFSQELVRMAPGAHFLPTVIARANGSFTGIPVSATFSSPAVDTFTIYLDTKTGEVIANTEGRATVWVEDPFTGTSASFDVEIVRPKLRPSISYINRYESVLLSLVDDNGNPVITDQSGMTWKSSNDLVASVVPRDAGKSNPQYAINRGSFGSAVITVTNPRYTETTTATVTIGSAPVSRCEYQLWPQQTCDSPRLITKQLPLRSSADQPIQLSTLFEYSLGTCPAIHSVNLAVPYTGSNWQLLGIPDLYRQQWNDAKFNLSDPSQSVGNLQLGAITLKPSNANAINVTVWFGAASNGIVGGEQVTCVFQQQLPQ